jgi:hypothetical protein
VDFLPKGGPQSGGKLSSVTGNCYGYEEVVVKLSKGHFLLDILVASGSTVYRTTDNYLSEDLDHGKVLLMQGTDNSNHMPGGEERQRSVGVGCSLARRNSLHLLALCLPSL